MRPKIFFEEKEELILIFIFEGQGIREEWKDFPEEELSENFE